MRLVSAKEAKEYFHITGPTLYQWKVKGKINKIQSNYLLKRYCMT